MGCGCSKPILRLLPTKYLEMTSEFYKLFVILSLAMVRRNHWFFVNCKLLIEQSCSTVTSLFMRELLSIFCVASLCVVG